MDIIKITSRQNEHIKHTQKLVKSRSFREEEKAFIVEGKKLCEEILKEDDIEVLKVFITEELLETLQEPLKSVYNESKHKFLVPDDILKKLSDTKNPQGIICVCRLEKKYFKKEDISENKKYLVLENISNPGNLGTIIRTAEAFFLDGLILCGNSVDIYNPKVVRASMGSVFRVKIFEKEDTLEVINIFKSKNITTYAAVLSDTAKLLSKTSFSPSSAVFVGNEGDGLLKQTYENCDENIIIDMNEKTESLNASVASAVLIWEMTKENR